MSKEKKTAEMQETVGGKTRQEWNKEAQQLLKRFRKYYRRNDGNGNRLENYDLTDSFANRRIEALLNSMKHLYEKYQEQFAELFPKQYDLGREWIDLQLYPCTYTEVDKECYLLHGAAIWMLDRIMERDDWRERMLPHLPRNEDFLMEVDWPDIWDTQHNADLIYSLQYVLYSRNADIGDNEETPDGKRRLTDTVTAERKHHAEVKSRQDYEAVISLIPQEQIDLAVRHYEEYFWQWNDRYFSCSAPMLKEINKLRYELDEKEKLFERLQAEQDEISKILDRKLKERRKQQKSMKSGKQGSMVFPLTSPASVLDNKDAFDAFRFPQMPGIQGEFVYKGIPVGNTGSFMDDPDMQRLKKVEDRLMKLVDELNETSDRLSELRNKKYQFMGEIVRQGRVSQSECRERFGEEVADAMSPIAIHDPYEACFALLYMIDNDYDLPWLYASGVGIAQEVGESLPWGILQYDEEEDDAWYIFTDSEGSEIDPLSVADSHKTGKVPEIPDWYERKYHPKKGDFDFPRSLAQILYEETGCLMPRYMHRYDGKAKMLSRYGIRGKDAVMMLTCMNALGNARRGGEALNLNSRYMHYLEVGEEAFFAENEESSEEPEDLAVKVAEQQEEIKQLRDALHDAEKTGREIRKELESERRTAALEHRELADLREIVFNRNNPAEEQSKPAEDVSFPYEVQKETLIFGGHDTWEKAIKPMLTGNVRFISKELTFDTTIIRHAEVIWVQSNAMSHTQYYRIVDTARLYKKPVRYFTNASAEKCAIQVIENDQ